MADPPTAAYPPMRIRTRTRDGITEATLLVPHPMETGLRKGANGRLAPSHFITALAVHVGSRLVLQAEMGMAVAADPILRFRFKGATPGDTITVSWADNRGQRRSEQAVLG